MMTSLRISSGTLKGKTIPLPPEVKGHREMTPQKVKSALFQLVANRIPAPEHTLFSDLFAGSGQISFEAVSRGFAKVICCEIDRRRYQALCQLQRHFALANQVKIIRGDGFKVFTRLLSHELQPATLQNLVVFADPPYMSGRRRESPWEKLVSLAEAATDHPNLLMILQAPKELANHFSKAQSYTYGKNCLLVFHFPATFTDTS